MLAEFLAIISTAVILLGYMSRQVGKVYDRLDHEAERYKTLQTTYDEKLKQMEIQHEKELELRDLENEQLKSAKKLVEDERDAEKSNNRALGEKFEQLERRFAELEKRFNEMSEKYDNEVNYSARLKEERDTANTAFLKASNDKTAAEEALKLKKQEFEQKLSNAFEQIDQIRQSLSDVNTQSEAKDKIINDLREKITDKDDLNQQLTKSLQQRDERIQKLEGIISDLNTKLEALTTAEPEESAVIED